MSARLRPLWGLIGILILCLPAVAPAEVDVSLLHDLQARAIGPAGMSGRIGAVAAAEHDPTLVYVGAATGGLWKSTDAGLTFEPVFDDQPVASIGAIAIDPHDSDVVWVGTGEGNLRNSVSVGNGVYRTRDGGRTWQHLGLEESERIHRIHLDPRDPQTAWVAALGKMWGDGEERGVYRTRDGGETWDRVLYVDARTGCADLAVDPTNPDRMFAAMYEHRRDPWFYRSGGPGSGLYRSLDGGDSWTRLTPEDGLTEGELGRIGLAIAPSDPRIVYALVEAKENRLYRSDDGGFTFADTGAREQIGNRPFYYADLRVDPEFPGRVYSLWSMVSVSDDYGRSFRTLVGWSGAHPDHHAMWIHPHDGNVLILGNDGGVYFSRDRGEHWRFASNLPVAQFYHIAVDDEVPYNLYGGMQDNGSWKGPSEVWENGGIRNHHWQELSFGDGFDTRPMPDDAMRGYSMSQEGFLYRWNLRDGEVRAVRPAPEGDEFLRFNWNAGLALDPFDPAGVYFGSQFLHYSGDRAESWRKISGDLTTNNAEWQKQADSGGLTPDVTGAENFTTIVAIAPSPHERGVVWVGTDDGRLQLTRDGGETWTSLEGRVKGVPKNAWIPHIAVSAHDPATAFVVFDDHRRSNLKPYVYRTTDYGRSWKSLATDAMRGYCLSIEQDPVNPDLLYLGTEFGLYLSFDAGRRWTKWTHGVPTCSVMDLTVQRRRGDLVLGTHGRSAFVLDDLTVLRQVDEANLGAPLHFFPVRDAQQHWVAQSGGERFPGATEFRGPNPAYGALLNFVVNGEGLEHPDPEIAREEKEAMRAESAESKSDSKDESKDESKAESKEADPKNETEVEIEILDAAGARVRLFAHEAHRGLNRVSWPLDSTPFRDQVDPADYDPAAGGGPQVLPGTYTVILRFRGEEARQTVRVLADPRQEIPMADREANWSAQQRAGVVSRTVAEALQRVIETREDVDAVTARIEAQRARQKAVGREWDDGEAPFADLEKAAQDLREQLDGLEKSLRTPTEAKGYNASENPQAWAQRARWMLGSSWAKPTPAALGYLALAERGTAEALEALNRFLVEDLPAFRDKVKQNNELELFSVGGQVELPPR